jgi:hypothetical protein
MKTRHYCQAQGDTLFGSAYCDVLTEFMAWKKFSEVLGSCLIFGMFLVVVKYF